MSRKISIALSFFLLSTTFGLNYDVSAEEEIPEWGFYVYMAGDNTLYDELTDDLNEMKMVGSNEDLEIGGTVHAGIFNQIAWQTGHVVSQQVNREWQTEPGMRHPDPQITLSNSDIQVELEQWDQRELQWHHQ